MTDRAKEEELLRGRRGREGAGGIERKGTEGIIGSGRERTGRMKSW